MKQPTQIDPQQARLALAQVENLEYLLMFCPYKGKVLKPNELMLCLEPQIGEGDGSTECKYTRQDPDDPIGTAVCNAYYKSNNLQRLYGIKRSY